MFDVSDGPSDMKIRLPNGAWQPLCTTPCAVDLMPGRVDVSFHFGNRGASATIDVPNVPTVYRRTLVERHESPVMSVAGCYALEQGGTLNSNAGPIITAIGAGITIGGGAAFYYGWPSERPAASTQFALPAR